MKSAFARTLSLLVRSVGSAALLIAFGFEVRPAGDDLTQARQPRERIAYVHAFDSTTRKPVLDLQPDAFIVREDGVRREVLRASLATTPMLIAMVIDNSQAMTPHISDLRKGLTAFVDEIGDIGPMSITTVADRPTSASDYTPNRKTLQAAVARLFAMPGSGATLLDGIRDVSKGLIKREGDRAAIVVLTSENREFSTLHYEQVLKEVRASGAALHVVVLTNPNADLNSDEARNRSFVLDRGPKDSGGLRIDVMTSMGFEPRLRELASILRVQYRLVYVRPESTIPPERFEVTMSRPGLEARGAWARAQGGQP